jgi:hypothetical protein
MDPAAQVTFDARTREAWRLALAAVAGVMQEGAAARE